MFRGWILIISFLLINTQVKAQVVNDNCANATFINIPEYGFACNSISNLNATPDGFSNTCDVTATPPLPVGGNEVWFTYIATGDSNFISVSFDGTPGSMVDPAITVITGTCGAFTTLICDASSPMDAQVNFNVPPGTQIWFYVTALTTDGSADLCVSSVSNAVTPGNCDNYTRLCSKELTFINPDINSTSAVIPSCFTNPPVHPQWLLFTVGTSGSFLFSANQLPSGGAQWALFEATDLVDPCNNPSLLMCNSYYQPGFGPMTFGMDSTVAGCATNSFCPPINVDSGKTYLLLIDDVNGNSDEILLEFSGTFEMGPTPEFTLSSDFICPYDSILVTYAGNATANALYNWNPPQSSNSYYVNYSTPGTYTIILQVAENGCSNLQGKQITVNPLPDANAGTDLSFCSASGQYTMGLPPTSGYIYNWIPSTNVNYPDSSQTPVYGVNLGVSDLIVEYTLVATLGVCHDTDYVDVTIHPRQYAAFTAPPAQCFNGNNFSFIPTGDSVENATFNWTFQSGSPASSNSYFAQGIIFPATGSYQVSLVTQSPNCPSDSSGVFIVVNPNPVAAFYSSINSGCPPLEVSFYNSSPPLAGGEITWQLGNGTIDTVSQDTATVIYNYSANYYPTITLTSADGCSTTDTIDNPVEVFPLPDASFYYTPTYIDDLNSNVSFFNNEPGVFCHYDFGDGDSSIDCEAAHFYTDTGSYLVTLIVTSVNGCIDTSYRIIEVHKLFTLYIPNAFSPNDDGRNDIFIIKGEGVVDIDLRIFNRRGTMVFKSNNINKTWNGKHMQNGGDVPDGVYVYEVTAKDSNRKKHNYKGTVTVIR